MLPLPATPFRAAAMASVTASRRSLISAVGSTYSVWSTWADLTLTAYVGVDTVEVIGPDGTVTHPRQRFGRQCIDYRRYVRELARKPQALRQVVAKLLPLMGERFAKAWAHLVDLQRSREPTQLCSRREDQAKNTTTDAEISTAISSANTFPLQSLRVVGGRP